MTVSRARIILIFVLFVLLFSILTLLFWDFIRDTIIVPIYYFIWVIGLILKSIPQGVYWAFLVLLSLIIGFKTLESTQVERNFERREGDQPQADTRYLYWRRLCTNMDISPFSRQRFAWEVRKLILSMLAYEWGIDIAEAETLILTGTLDIPDAIRFLIEEKRIPDAKPPLNRIASAILRLCRLLLKADSERDPQTDTLVAEIIGFIEQHLEIGHAGNQPRS
jgi:hypothetical protein